MVSADLAALAQQITELGKANCDPDPELWLVRSIYADALEDSGNSARARYYRWTAQTTFRPFNCYDDAYTVRHTPSKPPKHSYIQIPMKKLEELQQESVFYEPITGREAAEEGALRAVLEAHDYFEEGPNNG